MFTMVACVRTGMQITRTERSLKGLVVIYGEASIVIVECYRTLARRPVAVYSMLGCWVSGHYCQIMTLEVSR